MKTKAQNLKRLILAGSAVFVALSGWNEADRVAGYDLAVISSAYAAEDGGAMKGKGGQGSGGVKKGGSGTGGGKSTEGKLFRDVTTSVDSDSDRPVWAGVKGGKSGGGGKPVGAGSKKGDLFGDMVVLLRDANGEPILVDGLVQVIAYVYDASGYLVPLRDADGNLVVIPYTETGDLATQVTIGTTTYDVFGAEVDLGRLSVARSPSKVLNHALDEALAKLVSGTVTVDATGRLLVDGVTIDSPLENLALYDQYMSTGTLPGVTLPDGFDPAALLAAAADKTGTILVDTVVYTNSILGINSGTTYYDFSSVDYDRESTWGDVSVTVLVQQGDVYVPTTVNIYETLFNSTNWTDPTAVGGADDFATAADDYLSVIEFVHENAVR